MRRAALFALRSARRSALRKVITKSSSSFVAPNHGLASPANAHSSSIIRKYSTSRPPLQSSMRVPKVPLLFVGSLGAIGAWYAYRGDGTDHLLKAQPSPISAAPTRALSTTPDIASPTAEPADPAPVTAGQEPYRKALVVDN